jgi:Zn-dependent protease
MRLSFKLFNIPVVIGIDFLICVSILAYNRLTMPLYFVTWFIVVFISIMIHELGHALSFRLFGCTPWIRLYGFGGQTGIGEGQNIKPWQDLVTSIAGPAAGLLFGGIIILIQPFFPVSDIADQVFIDLIAVNIWWGLINLIPLYPLDGGHVAKIAIVHFFKAKGEKIFYGFSMVAAIAIGGVCVFLNQYWIAIISGFLFFNNLQTLRQLSEIGADRGLSSEFKKVYAFFQAGNFTDALTASGELYAKASTPKLKNHALNLGCWALYRLGNHTEALARLENNADPKLRDEFLYGILLNANSRYKEANDYLHRTFVSRLDNDTAAILIQNLEKLDDTDTLYKTIMMYQGARISGPLYKSVARFLYEKGKFSESVEVGSLQYSKFKDSNAAYNVACAKNRMGDKKGAIRWLTIAVKSGFSDWMQIAGDQDLADLATDAKFIEILENLRNKKV